MLYKEKACQQGNIVFVLNEEQNVMGYFAYAMDDEYPRIEQSFWMEEDQTEWAASRYFGKTAGWWKSFPYMIRVVDVTAFLQLFPKQCQRLSDGYEGLRIEDVILPENTGCYRADNGIFIGDNAGKIPHDISGADGRGIVWKEWTVTG